MGLYPNRKSEPSDTTYAREWTERMDCYGYVKERKVTATEWVEVERTDCYCCSCDDGPTIDPYCRNHGWYGERPCEVHNMPGSKGEDDEDMPESVQAVNVARKGD